MQPGRVALHFLIVRVQDSLAPRAFSAEEHQAATTALSVLMAKGVGTVLDLHASDFAEDGKIFTTAQAPYELVLLMGLPGEHLELATQKLIRLVQPDAGHWIAVLTSPVPLQSAARCEHLIEAALGAKSSASLHSSRHDDLQEALPNTLAAFAWQRVDVALTNEMTS